MNYKDNDKFEIGDMIQCNKTYFGIISKKMSKITIGDFSSESDIVCYRNNKNLKEEYAQKESLEIMSKATIYEKHI
jgi:hypothetical protein